jgi:hypothetical protein
MEVLPKAIMMIKWEVVVEVQYVHRPWLNA